MEDVEVVVVLEVELVVAARAKGTWVTHVSTINRRAVAMGIERATRRPNLAAGTVPLNKGALLLVDMSD